MLAENVAADQTVILALIGAITTLAGGWMLLGKKAWSLAFGKDGDGEGGALGKGIQAVKDLATSVESGMDSLGNKVEGLGTRIDKVADHQSELLEEFRKTAGE